MKTLIKKQLFFSILFLVISFGADSQRLRTGPQVLSFQSKVDNTDQPYGLYLPRNFDESKVYPLVVMLHGAGSNHRLALRRVFGKSNANGERDVVASQIFPRWKDVDYIVASPLARGTMGYQGIAEKDVWDVIADVKSRFKIDENRTYLTGLSMGGGGTLWIGLTRPDFWAAIAPVCPAPPEGTEAYLANANSLPTHFFQGEIDPVVPKKKVDEWVENFKKTGTHVEYSVYPGVQHNSWEKAYENGQLFDWFSQYKRNPNPGKVIFTTGQLKYNQSYWLEIVALGKERKAKVEAEITGKNSISIKSEGVEALRIHQSPKIELNKDLRLTINGKHIILKNFSGNEIVQISEEGELKLRKESYMKTSTQSGPMTEIAADRHIYVYGTLDSPNSAELDQRKKIAEEAADWSYYRGEFLGRVMVFPIVMSDKEVQQADLDNANLVLFGTAETNAMIAKYADRLPLRFEGSNDQSLTFIFPKEEKMILVNSGLPFWLTPDRKDNGMKILRSPSKVDMLNESGDWIFFDGQKSISGYFDNQWSFTPEDKARLSEIQGIKVK